VEIDLCHLDVVVAEEPLHHGEWDAAAERLCGERVAEHVGPDVARVQAGSAG